MVFLVMMLADTLAGIMLCDISKMFAHAFTNWSLGVTNVLFKAYSAGNAVYDIVCFAVAMEDGVVFTSCYRTGDGAGVIVFHAVSA